MDNDTISRFPNRRDSLSMSLSGEQLTLEGMKVIFDENITLFPVDLEASKPNHNNVVRYGRDKRG